MATSEGNRDNVTELGIREAARLKFEPSEVLADSMAELFTDEYRSSLGETALYLYSDFAQSVRRRNGVVIGENGPLEAEMNGIIHRASPKPKLARYINAERGRSVPTNIDLYILRLAVRLDTNTINAIQESQTISSRFVSGIAVPVRAMFPAEALLPVDARRKAIDDLIELVLDMEGNNQSIDLRAEASNPHASVKNMQMAFRQIHQ